MPKSWFHVRGAAETGGAPEILIYDEIGRYGVSAKAFDEELKALGSVTELTLRINSPGGDVFAGNAIFNMLKRWKSRSGARIVVYVDGLAASMGSLIAMVGDEVVMPANAMMMIHDPATIAIGNAGEMREAARFLDKVKAGMVLAYATKSGKGEDEISFIMEAETWFTAEEAVAQGFADVVEAAMDVAAVHDAISSYNFTNAPDVEGINQEVDMTDKNEAKGKAKPEDKAKPEAKADEERRVEERRIAAVCRQADLPAKAALDFITAGLTLAEVIDAIDAKAEEKDDEDEAKAESDEEDEAKAESDDDEDDEDDEESKAKKSKALRKHIPSARHRSGTGQRRSSVKVETLDTDDIYARFNRRNRA